MNKKTITTIFKQKNKKKLTMLTCYDYSTAKILAQTNLDMILVGDSLGNVFAGHESTLPVTVEDIIYHTRAVKRALKEALIVADMPFLSYQVSLEEGIRNAGRMMKEALCDAIKLEGGTEICPLVEKLVKAGIPVMGHIGLQPQSVHQLGGYRVVGKTLEEQERLLDEALMLEKAGAFAIVLELVPANLAQKISEKLRIPTIGIGSGNGCDGQVLVINDMLGMNPENLKHNKKFLNLYQEIQNAVNQYITEVEEKVFPSQDNCF
jgi:3-methyl-2-oxobutanoate hydroxymethyltransferase